VSARAATQADRLLARLVTRFGPNGPAVVLIDGRAGSGKTTLASHVARSLGADLVHLDDLYPGWDGLAEGAIAAETDVLSRGGYRRYDWASAELAEWVPVDRSRTLVIEGCGAITAGAVSAARTLGKGHSGAVVAVWVECPEPVRQARALGRDGEMFRPHFERWAIQEAEHFSRNRPLAFTREIVYTGQ
jgi:adenylate kinase family enzyme